MTSRSRQAARLAQLLGAATERRVIATYDGPRKGQYGGWHLEWVDGPTRDRMRALATEFADQAPDLDLDEVRFYRAQSDTGAHVVAAVAGPGPHPRSDPHPRPSTTAEHSRPSTTPTGPPRYGSAAAAPCTPSPDTPTSPTHSPRGSAHMAGTRRWHGSTTSPTTTTTNAI